MLTKELIKELIFKTRKKLKVIDRQLTSKIRESVIIKSIIIVTGVRRSGKSTILKTLASEIAQKKPKNVLYINFEDERFSGIKVTELDQLLLLFEEITLPKGRIFLFFDEIQNIEKWEKWVTKKYEQEGKKIKFFLSGSNASMLSSELATALSGRNIPFELFPISFKEFLKMKNISLPVNLSEIQFEKISIQIKNKFEKYLYEGGFPESLEIINKELRERLLQTYFTDIVHRDILFRHDIKDVKYFEEFAKYFMTNFTNEFTYNNLMANFEYGINTIIRYLSYLQESFLLFQVPLFSYSLKKQQANPKKIYCIDNGMRNAVSFKFSKDEGRLAENLVFIELKRRGRDPYYWKGEGEVDFVIKEKDNSLTAINVSYTNEIEERELMGLKDFKKIFKKNKKMILLTKDVEKEEDGIIYIPLWKWLLS